jgi:hypothetical protein
LSGASRRRTGFDARIFLDSFVKQFWQWAANAKLVVISQRDPNWKHAEQYPRLRYSATLRLNIVAKKSSGIVVTPIRDCGTRLELETRVLIRATNQDYHRALSDSGMGMRRQQSEEEQARHEPFPLWRLGSETGQP